MEVLTESESEISPWDIKFNAGVFQVDGYNNTELDDLVNQLESSFLAQELKIEQLGHLYIFTLNDNEPDIRQDDLARILDYDVNGQNFRQLWVTDYENTLISMLTENQDRFRFSGTKISRRDFIYPVLDPLDFKDIPYFDPSQYKG